MTLEGIEKMIENARFKWAINNEFAMDCKRNNNPDGFLYTVAKMKYNRIIKRLEQAKQNLL
jgi:hypothetical protein